MNTKTIPERSTDTELLIVALQSAEPGEVVGYAKLNAAIRRNVQAEARSVLTSARNVLSRDHGMLFESIPNVGLKLMKSGEIADAALGYVQRTYRSAKRGQAKIAMAHVDELTPQQQRSVAVAHSVLGMIAAASRPKRIKEVAALPSADAARLAIEGINKAFSAA